MALCDSPRESDLRAGLVVNSFLADLDEDGMKPASLNEALDLAVDLGSGSFV